MIIQKKITTFISKWSFKLALVMALMGNAVSSQAQQVTTPERGFVPAGSYLLSDIETISTTGGNLLFNIPLTKLPAGRAGFSTGLSLVYNSKLYDSHLEGDGFGGLVEKLDASPHGGWRYAFDYKLHLQFRPDRDSYTCDDPYYIYSTRLVVSFPDGSTKEFRPTGRVDAQLDGYFDLYPDGRSTSCNGGYATTNTVTYYSVDGSYMRLDVEHDGDTVWQNNNWTLSFPDGSKATGRNVTRNLYDRNGNIIMIRGIEVNGHPATRIFDQMDREIIIEYTGQGVDYVYQKGSNGETLTWTIASTTIQGADYTIQNSDGSQASYPLPYISAVTQITLPAQTGGLAYGFTYYTNSTQPTGYGEVGSITLPTGAQANYSYQLHAGDYPSNLLQNSPTQKTLTYQREYDGSSTPATETWTYSLAAGTGNPSVVTGPDGGVLREWAGSINVAPNYRILLPNSRCQPRKPRNPCLCYRFIMKKIYRPQNIDAGSCRHFLQMGFC